MCKFTQVILLVSLVMLPVCAEAQTVNKVVAAINDEVITQQDVGHLLAILYAQYVQEYKGDELVEKMEEAKRDILKQMIEDKLILSRAKELNIKVRDEEVKEKLLYIKSGFPSEEAFNDTLRTQGITMADLKNRYKDQILMKKVVDFEVRSRVNVLPSEITEYYEKHREDFKMNDKRKVRHILIKAENDVSYELAKVEIEGIYDRLKEGQDFTALATQYSQGPNKEQGGDMGYVQKGEMLPELEKAIFNLGPGEISTPIKSKIGYHIFKVEDVTYSGYMSLEGAQRDIKVLLFQQKMREKLDEWLVELRSKAYINIK
ncbi:MAG: peptidylprolyl isomerase [Candidatus Omnitrophica bacterium]|nr:peptidylprolyl isomerase [Candidatus Omnitrophota bacterium]MBU1933339.1 peptidylprolyl isomerase [Candidatus Omnitrophota bacterium]